MPHAKFDDRFPDHPKIAGLSDAAYRLHSAGIIYCARHLTDGLINADELPRLVRRFRKAALTELVDRCLWVPVFDGAAYTIHDYLQWNDSREVVEGRLKKAKERKDRWLAARDAARDGES